MLMTMNMRALSTHTCTSGPRTTPGEHARSLTSTAGRSRKEDMTRSDSASVAKQDGWASWPAVWPLAAAMCASNVNLNALT